MPAYRNDQSSKAYLRQSAQDEARCRTGVDERRRQRMNLDLTDRESTIVRFAVH